MIEIPNGRSEWRLMLARNFYRRAADEGNAAVSELEERRALIICLPFLHFLTHFAVVHLGRVPPVSQLLFLFISVFLTRGEISRPCQSDPRDTQYAAMIQMPPAATQTVNITADTNTDSVNLPNGNITPIQRNHHRYSTLALDIFPKRRLISHLLRAVLFLGGSQNSKISLKPCITHTDTHPT